MRLWLPSASLLPAYCCAVCTTFLLNSFSVIVRTGRALYITQIWKIKAVQGLQSVWGRRRRRKPGISASACASCAVLPCCVSRSLDSFVFSAAETVRVCQLAAVRISLHNAAPRMFSAAVFPIFCTMLFSNDNARFPCHCTFPTLTAPLSLAFTEE